MDIKQETKNEDCKGDSETPQISLKLKYERFTGDINSKTENDSVLCLKAHHKFIVAAMKSGIVYILNRSDGNVKKQYTPHQHAVSDISIDKWGRHIATCCEDGTVVIMKIVSNTYKSTQHKFKNQQLLSIELHPNYDTKPMFVTGGVQQELILKTVGFFSTKKTLHCNDGSIYCIAWKDELIAWVNDTKVNLYDIVNYVNIAQINGSGGSECCLCWEDSKTLLIASTHCVTIAEINQMKKVSTRKITTEFCICSIAPYEKYIVLLAVDESKTPQIRIISRNGSDVVTHNLDINKYDNNRVCDYNLECVVKSANNKQWTCYVTSPKDVIICKQWAFIDDITLLYSNGKCEEAWLQAIQHQNELNKSETNLEILGQKMLDYILSNEEHKFGKLCKQICDKNRRLWEKWINILSEKKKLNLIIPFIPRNEIHLAANLHWMVIKEINAHKEEYDESFVDSWRDMENSSKAKKNEVNERKEQNDDNLNDKKQNGGNVNERNNEQKMVVVEEEKKEIYWNHLIERTLRDADELMPKLLDAVKGHPNVDAHELIQKIPNKLTIVGLKQKMIAIFEEYSSDKLLTKGTTNILRSDCLKLGNKLYIEAAKGVIVNNSNYGSHNMPISLCMVCQLPLKVSPSYYKKRMVNTVSMEELLNDTLPWNIPSIKMFYCGHFYHINCYREEQYYGIFSEKYDTANVDKCLVCFSQQNVDLKNKWISYCGENASLWEKLITFLSSKNKLDLIINKIPPNKIKLTKHSYDIILKELSKHKYENVSTDDWKNKTWESQCEYH